MSAQRPHYFLFSQTQPNESQDGGLEASGGLWRFLLAAVDGCTRFEVSDREPEITGDRLDMLAVLRGLEALDQPSRVTLHTSSRYVFRGFRFGLPAWRLNNWCWEKFGVMEPVSNCDLWQRIDRALQFHQVQCHRWQPKPATRQDIWLAPIPEQTSVAAVETEFGTNTPDIYEPYEGYSSGQAFGQANAQHGPANARQMAEWAGMFQPRQRRAAVA